MKTLNGIRRIYKESPFKVDYILINPKTMRVMRDEFKNLYSKELGFEFDEITDIDGIPVLSDNTIPYGKVALTLMTSIEWSEEDYAREEEASGE